MDNLLKYQLDHLQDLLGGTSFDFRGIYLSNVKIRGSVRVVGNGDIVLDSGRGIKWDKVGIAFGLISSVPAVSFYVNNALTAHINSGGLSIDVGSIYITTGQALYDSTSNYGVKFETVGGIASVAFYTAATRQAFVNGTYGISVGAVTDISTTNTHLSFGQYNSKDGFGFYTGGFLRHYFNIDGLSLTGSIFLGGTVAGSLTGYTGTATSIDLFISGTERAAIASNAGSSVNSPLYLDLGGTLSQVKYDNSDLGSGTKHYLYII